MPASEQIVLAAASLANDWMWLAVWWHVALGGLVAAFASGWRPSRTVLGRLLLLPIVSVAALAWATGNPFTGLMFALLAAATLRAAAFFPRQPARVAASGWVAAGLVLVIVGGLYPHFVRAEHPFVYLYGSPFGLLPCPTLLVVTGMTLAFGGFNSAAWSRPVVAADILYGLIGVVSLGVMLDLWLLGGALLLIVMTVTRAMRTGASDRGPDNPLRLRSRRTAGSAGEGPESAVSA